MVIIFGLGNPGKKFAKTPHNLGFRAIDAFWRKNRNVFHLSHFKLMKEFQAEISEGQRNGQKIILAKPQTFMNLSGRAVKKIIDKYKLKIENLFVIHDDLDLPLGKIRISIGRGSAGHKGVQSIIDELKTKNFVRFRIGISPISTFSAVAENVEKFVLKKFNREEEKILKKIIKKTVEAIEFVLKTGLEKGMNKYNQ